MRIEGLSRCRYCRFSDTDDCSLFSDGAKCTVPFEAVVYSCDDYRRLKKGLKDVVDARVERARNDRDDK